MKALMLVFLCLSATAHADHAYKCKAADGSIAFQQTPCAGEQLGDMTFNKAPDAPHQQYVPSQSREKELAAQSDAAVSSWSGDQLRAPENSATQQKGEGYRCTGQHTTWVQATPCPSSSSRVVSRPVSGNVSGTGQPVSGWVDVRETTPIRQSEISKEELCKQIIKSERMSGGKERSADESYERNRLRRENGCS